MKNNKENVKEKRNLPHFNALDAFIVILVVAVIVGIYFRYSILDFLTGERNNEKYVISFSIDDMRYTTPNYINVGDEVYFASNGKFMGTLISESENQGVLNITPSSKYFTDSNGNIVEAFYPNEESRVDAKGRLLCLGRYNAEGGFYVEGNTHIGAGQLIKVRTDTVSVTLKVTSIDPYEE